jgi:hypothetical protein
VESLRETVVRECAKCEPIVLAWVAGDLGFAIQTRVSTKSAKKKGDDGEWTYIEPVRVTSAAWDEAEEVVARVKKVHPGASATLVSYVFRPGGLYVEVFRRAA